MKAYEVYVKSNGSDYAIGCYMSMVGATFVMSKHIDKGEDAHVRVVDVEDEDVEDYIG